MNSRLKPTWLKVADAPERFNVVVNDYGIDIGKYGESDFIIGDFITHGGDVIQRKIRLNQKSLLYLAEHKIAPTESNLKDMLPGKELIFEIQKIGNFQALVVVGIVKGGKKE